MKIWAKRIALALVTGGLCLLLAEMSVRLFGLGPDLFAIERGMLRLSPLPGVVYELTPDFNSADGAVQINSRGLRQGPVSLSPEPSGTRIAVIGDSIAFGMGADPAGHFSVHLEAFMNRSDSPLPGPVEVLNFGVPGYNITQVAATLEHRVPSFHPDYVIYLYCLNDPQPYSRELAIMLQASGESAAVTRYVQHNRRGQRPLWMRSRLAWLAAGAWQGDREPLPQDPGEWDDMMQLLQGTYQAYYRRLYQDPLPLERLENGLDRIAAWQQHRRIPIAIILFPVFANLEDYAFVSEHEWLQERIEQRGLSALDLLPAFQAASRTSAGPLHADPLHPNRSGYRLAAETVASALADRFWGAQHVP